MNRVCQSFILILRTLHSTRVNYWLPWNCFVFWKIYNKYQSRYSAGFLRSFELALSNHDDLPFITASGDTRQSNQTFFFSFSLLFNGGKDFTYLGSVCSKLKLSSSFKCWVLNILFNFCLKNFVVRRSEWKEKSNIWSWFYLKNEWFCPPTWPWQGSKKWKARNRIITIT